MSTISRPLSTTDSKVGNSQARWFGAAGIVAAIAGFGGGFVYSGLPAPTTSAATTTAYYHSHSSTLTAVDLAQVLSAVLLVVFAAGLRGLLQGDCTHPNVFPTAVFGGAVLLGGGVLSQAAINLAAVTAANDHIQAAVQTLNTIADSGYLLISGGIAAMYLSLALATRINHTIPTWFGWYALLPTVLALCGPAGHIAPAPAMLGVVMLSVLAIRRKTLA